jgi:hypothetical protein
MCVSDDISSVLESPSTPIINSCVADELSSPQKQALDHARSSFVWLALPPFGLTRWIRLNLKSHSADASPSLER